MSEHNVNIDFIEDQNSPLQLGQNGGQNGEQDGGESNGVDSGCSSLSNNDLSSPSNNDLSSPSNNNLSSGSNNNLSNESGKRMEINTDGNSALQMVTNVPEIAADAQTTKTAVDLDKEWLDKIGVCGILRLETTEPYARLISGILGYKYQAVGFYFMITDERGSNYSVYLFNSYDGAKPEILPGGNISLFLLLGSGKVKRVEAQPYTGNSQEFVNALMHITSQNIRGTNSKVPMSTESFHEQCCHRISGLSYQHNQTGDKMVARVVNLLKSKKKDGEALFSNPVVWESHYELPVSNSRKEHCQQLLLKLADVFYSEEGQRLDLASKFAGSVVGDSSGGGLSLAKMSALEQLLQKQNALLRELIEIKQTGVLYLGSLDESISSLQQIATKLGVKKLPLPDRTNQSCIWFIEKDSKPVSDLAMDNISNVQGSQVNQGNDEGKSVDKIEVSGRINNPVTSQIKGKVLLNSMKEHLSALIDGRDFDATTFAQSFNELIDDVGMSELETSDVAVRHCLVRTKQPDKGVSRLVSREVQQRFHFNLCSRLDVKELEHLSKQELYNLSRYLDSLDDPNMIGTINNIVSLMVDRAERLTDDPDD